MPGTLLAPPAPQSTGRTITRMVLAIGYLIAGIAHLRSPAGFLQITPAWVPYPATVIALTGLAELAGAVALAAIARLRKAAGIGLALYAVCVFPANINHALNHIAIGGTQLSWWYHAPRFALQPVLVWLALWTGGVTDWPFRSRA
ncbi:MAG: DoxX family protein [Novosphingobium sp.]